MLALIVEDDFAQAELMTKALEGRGFQCDLARTVGDAMSHLLRRRYDLVVLDLFLPDGASVSLSNYVRIRYPSSPILSVTGTSLFANGDHNEAMSADYLLRKPVKSEEIAEIAVYLTRGSRDEAMGRSLRTA